MKKPVAWFLIQYFCGIKIIIQYFTWAAFVYFSLSLSLLISGVSVAWFVFVFSFVLSLVVYLNNAHVVFVLIVKASKLTTFHTHILAQNSTSPHNHRTQTTMNISRMYSSKKMELTMIVILIIIAKVNTFPLIQPFIAPSRRNTATCQCQCCHHTPSLKTICKSPPLVIPLPPESAECGSPSAWGNDPYECNSYLCIMAFKHNNTCQSSNSFVSHQCIPFTDTMSTLLPASIVLLFCISIAISRLYIYFKYNHINAANNSVTRATTNSVVSFAGDDENNNENNNGTGIIVSCNERSALLVNNDTFNVIVKNYSSSNHYQRRRDIDIVNSPERKKTPLAG